MKMIAWMVAAGMITTAAGGLLRFGTRPSVGVQESGPAAVSASTPVVLVELFTSEGCSDCPPADRLLATINGKRSPDGQLVVGVSEHVTYWNRLGWVDPYSTTEATDRQSRYGNRFDLDSVYTPQMVVNGREQFVGGDQEALRRALHAESQRPAGMLKITAAAVDGAHLQIRYEVQPHPGAKAPNILAMIVDDLDRSQVGRGENAGRTLEHTNVARSTISLGRNSGQGEQSADLALPEGVLRNRGAGHHVILFAQESDAGPVVGSDARAF